MIHEMNCAPQLAPSGETSQREQDRLVGELQEAVEVLEHTLTGLRKLSNQTGYDFVDRLLPGYEWVLNQIAELNTGLVTQAPFKSNTRE